MLAQSLRTWLFRGMMHVIREVKVCTVRDTTPVVRGDTPQLCARFWRQTIARAPWFDPCKEHLVTILLNVRYRIIAYNLVSVGSLNENVAHPREIFRPAIAAAAYAFVLAHNHPSGNPSPSAADGCLTSRIEDGAQLLGLKFLDHVIIGDRKNYFSFEEYRENHPRLAKRLLERN